MEVLEECEGAIARHAEIHKVAGNGVHDVKDASARGRSCRRSGGSRCLRCMILWGRIAEEEEGTEGLLDTTALGVRAPLDVGGGRGGRLVKALFKVLHVLHQPALIDHRVSVVLPYD